MRNALNDFRRAAKVNARDPDLRKKLEQCEREVKRLRFEDALSTPVRLRRMCCMPHMCAQPFVVWRVMSRRRIAVQAGFKRLRFKTALAPATLVRLRRMCSMQACA